MANETCRYCADDGSLNDGRYEWPCPVCRPGEFAAWHKQADVAAQHAATVDCELAVDAAYHAAVIAATS